MTEDRRPARERPGHVPLSRALSDDQALFERMAAGDEAALAALYDQWGARVHTVAFCILRDADDAEEVVEETFWQAWRTAAQFDGRRGPAPTWLIIIARSRALDRLRLRRRSASRLADAAAVEGLLEHSGCTGSDIAAPDLITTERSHALAIALAALPPEQRQAIELAFFAGLSHGEIAAHLTLPLGTVKTRLRLAMQKLRTQLAELRKEGP